MCCCNKNNIRTTTKYCGVDKTTALHFAWENNGCYKTFTPAILSALTICFTTRKCKKQTLPILAVRTETGGKNGNLLHFSKTEFNTQIYTHTHTLTIVCHNAKEMQSNWISWLLTAGLVRWLVGWMVGPTKLIVSIQLVAFSFFLSLFPQRFLCIHKQCWLF